MEFDDGLQAKRMNSSERELSIDDFEYSEADDFSSEPADEEWLSRSEERRVRWLFLDAIQNHAPWVLERLRKIQRRPKEERHIKHIYGDLIHHWAVDYYLTNELGTSGGSWLLTAGRRTVQYWDQLPIDSDKSAWSPDAADADLFFSEKYGDLDVNKRKTLTGLLESSFEFTFSSWDPRTPWNEYKSKLNESLKGKLQQYHDSVESASQINQFDVCDAPKRSVIHTSSEQKHFKWLVMRQIQGKSYSDIAKAEPENDEDPPHSTTISRGVQKAAKLVIGARWKSWLLPPKRGGRRPDNSKLHVKMTTNSQKVAR